MSHKDPLDILVIEDEPGTAKTLSLLLNHKFSANTAMAHNCESARNMLKDSNFTLITLDYQLPDGNGLELLEEIVSMDNPPPVIMVTGHGDEKVASKAFTLGASGYVVKDNRMNVMLQDAVEHALSSLALKRAEKEAQQERERSKTYLEITPVMILALDNNGKITMINRKGCELLGYQESELIGKDYFEGFVPENSREKAQESFKRVIEDAESYLEDYLVPQVGRDEYERIIVWHKTPLKDEEGRIIGLLSSGVDITEQLRAERITRAQRDLAIRLSGTDDFDEIMSIYFQAIIDTSDFDSGSIHVLDEDTGAFDQIYHHGLTDEYADLYKHIPADSPGAKILNQGTAMYTDYENIQIKHTEIGRREGMKSIAVIPMIYKGKVIGSINLTSHRTNTISEYSKRIAETLSDQVGQVLTRSRLSEALKGSEAKLRSLFNNAPGAIAVFDRDGVITDINDTLCGEFGLIRDEIIGMKSSELPFLSDKDKNKITRMRTKRLSGEELQPYIIEYTQKDGENHFYNVTGSTIEDDNENIIGGMVILSDITGRILEETTLKEFEREYKSIFENTKELIITVDGNSIITSINPAAVEVLGYEDKTELIGTNISEHYMNIEDREPLFRKIVTQGYVNDYEMTFKRKDGSPLYVIGSAVAYFDESGNPLKCESVLTDITRHKEADEALRESEELFRSIFDNAAVGIAIIDLQNQNLFEANEALCRITGYSKEELSGQGYYETFSHEIPDIAYTEIEKVMKDKQDQANYEHKINKKDGTTAWLTDRVAILGGKPDQDLTGVFFSSDITEQKLAEEELNLAKTRWERTFEQLDSCIFLLDPSLEILQCNKALCELTGKTPEEAIGMKCYELLHGADHPIDDCVCVKALKSRKSEFGELYEPNVGKYLEISANPILDQDGNIEQFVHVIQDASDRKTAESELQKYKENLEVLVSERTSELEDVNKRLLKEVESRSKAEANLKSVNAELEGYAHTVSHDLKGPLSSIALSSDLLIDETEAINNEETKAEITDLISNIKKNSRKAFDLTEDILSLSRAGNIPTELEEVDIKDIIHEVLAERKELIEKKKVTFSIDEYLGTLTANPTQIYELFSNIIGNSIFHSNSKKPEVTISFLGKDEAGLSKYLISDNGSGVSSGEEEAIFEAFSKGPGSKGTGIGLAIAKKIVGSYSGEIKAYNDSGACFEFTIKDFAE